MNVMSDVNLTSIPKKGRKLRKKSDDSAKVHTIWIKYSVWIVLYVYMFGNCIDVSYRHQVWWHTNTPMDSSILSKHSIFIYIRIHLHSLFLFFFNNNKKKQKEKKRKDKLMSKITNETWSCSRLIDIWLWGRLQFNRKKSYPILFVWKRQHNTHRISYRTSSLFFDPFGPHKTQGSTFLWCYIVVVIKQNQMFGGTHILFFLTLYILLPSLCSPATIASHRIVSYEKEEKSILRIVDIDAAYLHNQKCIHLHRLVRTSPVQSGPVWPDSVKW